MGTRAGLLAPLSNMATRDKSSVVRVAPTPQAWSRPLGTTRLQRTSANPTGPRRPLFRQLDLEVKVLRGSSLLNYHLTQAAVVPTANPNGMVASTFTATWHPVWLVH